MKIGKCVRKEREKYSFVRYSEENIKEIASLLERWCIETFVGYNSNGHHFGLVDENGNNKYLHEGCYIICKYPRKAFVVDEDCFEKYWEGVEK